MRTVAPEDLAVGKDPATRPVPPISVTYRRLLIALVLVPYNAWLLGPWLWVGRMRPGYLSELAAQDQPWQWLFRGGDMLAGALLIAVAVLGRRRWRCWLSRWAPGLVIGSILAGGATFLDAILNLPCSLAASASCQKSATLATRLHEVSSVLAGAGFITMLAAVFLGLRLTQGWTRTTRLAAAATALVVVADVLVVLFEFLLPGAQLWPQICATLVYDALFVVIITRLGPCKE
ncbi:Uncharacterised protein [Actinomyces bovis]|uniref:DUF998 domain-containing protein n=1 Tax=Actinomyces bovis TaxID=1658 RepID=A0ABY1VMH0_9ACTO|nr:DUF998 domain-containing protein [Actinomyces bovis]SPT52881.1 Uncharacterised protein [Actinomyces bovis]VEG55004.1 Uncharacterised protein [Actinomyces israelii]